jgi:hypothetical protein
MPAHHDNLVGPNFWILSCYTINSSLINKKTRIEAAGSILAGHPSIIKQANSLSGLLCTPRRNG